MIHHISPVHFALLLVFTATAIPAAAQDKGPFQIRQNAETGAIIVERSGTGAPVLTQEAQNDMRPFIHPLVAPDGKGVLTQRSPDHHKHQTGLYWGFKNLNGRDYFHHPEGDYWRRQEAQVLPGKDKGVAWKVAYDLLDKGGAPLLTETQSWSLHEEEGRYILDLVWSGRAHVDVTIGKSDYGGLFLRMPWQRGNAGVVTNIERQTNRAAEGQRAQWLDVAMEIEGRDDLAHIAIFDHHKNQGFPQPWRVDGQLGVGPARSRLGEWKIAKNKTETIRHRFIVYTGALDTLGLTTAWRQYTGRSYTSSQWKDPRKAGRAAAWLTPAAAVKEMTVTPGFDVSVWASEPMMTQPMAFCWDDRGRMWIAENRDYETRGKGFSKFGDSRILILEDSDRDGVADKRTVFLEGIPFPAAIAVGMGGLWLGAPPNLLFIPDSDGDDKADMDAIEVRLTGWGIRDRHETLNSFYWGPDGWLYGCQGFATPSMIGKPVGQGRLLKVGEGFPKNIPLDGEGIAINGGVWRYHPVEERFEVVSHGFSNPWGIDYDANGQLFITACVIPHLFYIIPGGIYHRQGGRHFNPYVYDDIKTIVDHHHRSAHGGARIYLSDAFPDKYQGQLFMANIHEHAILSDVLEPKGSGFVARHGSDFLHANNAQWIGFSMEIGPGGDVYVLDWHDGDICGNAVLNKDSGRIFRIAPQQSAAVDWPGRYEDLGKLGDAALVQLQESPSAWHARRARVILQGRAAAGTLEDGTHARLRRLFEESTETSQRLRAMWALHITGGSQEAALIAALDDDEVYIRAWAIQLLCEDAAPVAVLPKFAELAQSDPSPVVRLYLASAMQRLEHAARWPIANALAAHGEDARDHNLSKMIWFGIEPAVAANPARALQLANASKLPRLVGYIARRLTAANELTALVKSIAEHPGTRQTILGRMRDELRGRDDPIAPPNWEHVYAQLKEDKSLATIATELAQRFGDRNAALQLLATLDDKNAAAQERQRALQALSGVRHADLRERLITLLDEPELRMAAIRAAAAYEDSNLAVKLLTRYAGFSTDEKRATILTLAARSQSGYLLMQALKKGEVPRRDIPAYVARQLLNVIGVGFVEVWGPIDQLAGDKKAALDKYLALLTDAKIAGADPSKGRAVFDRTCAACHTMYGVGDTIGPDITGSNRADLNYILNNVLDPSEEIQDDYRMLLVLTRDGRTYAGTVASEDPEQLTLRVAGEVEPVFIAKSEIQARKIAPVSIMPTGLLTTLTDDEVLNLIAYLRTSNQVELPEGSSEGR